MPPAPGNGRLGPRRAAPKPKAAPRVVGNADTGDTARSRPAPRAAKPVFKQPVVRAPFAAQQQQAQQQVRTSRRALPAPVLAQPPIIGHAGPSRPAAHEPKMSRQQVTTFLRSQAPVTQHAREQIVGSIRKQVEGSTGVERQQRVLSLLDEIATDPRLARTRRAIRHYTALEQQTARPQTRDELKAGPGDHKAHIGVGGLNFATVNTTAVSRVAEKVGAKVAPGLQGNSPERKFTKNALSDIAHLPLMAPQTVYEVGMAAKEAAGGDTKRAQGLVKGLLDGVYGHLARGDVNGAVEYFRQHPIYAILEVRGGKGVVGRGAGAVMRSGVVGDAAKAAASTKRADIRLSDSGAHIADRQHYSPDVLTKLAQVAGENSNVVQAFKNAGRDHRLRRRADFESDTAAATSRAVRQDEGHKAAEAKPKGPLAEVVGLAVQGVIRPASLEADLRKELKRLDDAHATAEFSTGAQKRQNRTTADAIRKVLGSPQAMARIGEVAQSARSNVRDINALERKGEELNASTPARNARAKLFPAAQAHLGAEYSDAPFKAAREREVAAGRALRTERTRLTEKVREIKAAEDSAATRITQIAQKHKAERGKEGHNQQIAAYYVGAQRFDLRAEAVAAHKEAMDAGINVGDIRRVSLTHADAKRVGELSSARRNYQAILKRRRAAEAELRALDKTGDDAVPARKAFEDARGQRKAAMKGGTRSLHVAGRFLPNDEIKAAIGEDVAYLPHHTQARGAKAHYQTAFAGRKNLDSGGKRTGAAFEKGVVDSSYEAVTEHRQRLRGVINRIAEHDRIIGSISIKGEGGKMMTWDQAEKIASNAKDKTGARLVPYRAMPGSYDKARMAKIMDSQGAPDSPDLAELVGHEFAERLKAPAEGDRSAPNVVLVPAQMINQLKEQQAVSSTRGKAGNVLADVFRRTVLPFSTKWLTGNDVEAALRLAMVGAGPNAHRIGKALIEAIEKIDHDEAIRVRAALTSGLMYGNKGLTVKRLNEHFTDTALEKPAAALSVVGQLPIVHPLGQLIKKYTDAVLHFNGKIEQHAQYAALGKWAKREMQEMGASWRETNISLGKYLDDVAQGMVDPRTSSKNIHDAARYLDQTLGQYSRFSPAMRRIIQQAMPFLPWYLNAARFVFWTLPAKHPIKSGIFALVANNLQADYDASHSNLPPGDLRGDIVADDGTVLPYSRYTPFGAFGTVLGGGDEQLTAIVDPLFPQFKSAALAAFGLNFAGRSASIPPEDRGADGRGVPGVVRTTMAVNALLEAFVPMIGIGKRIREGGSTGYDNSTIVSPKTKPDSHVTGGAARRILDPTRPSPIKGEPKSSKAKPAATATPAPSAPAPAQSPEDQLLDNLYQSLDDAQSQQAVEDQLLNNLYGGG